MGIRVGIAGCGRFAPGFIRYFRDHPQVDHVALCDIVPERVAENLKRFGLTEGYTNLDELCRADLDAIAVMTQPWMHASQCIQVMESGKHVWSAVPLVSLTDGDEMLEWCNRVVETSQRTGMHYFLAETSCYHPGTMFCRRKMAEGAFGRLIHADGRYFHDYNVPGPSNLITVDKTRWGDDWDRTKSGMTPMYYPTHSLGGLLSVVEAKIKKICCFGYTHPDDDYFREDTIFGNPFSNETAVATLDNGMNIRFSEGRRVAGQIYEGIHELVGTEGFFLQPEDTHALWSVRHQEHLEKLSPEQMQDRFPDNVAEKFCRNKEEGVYGDHQGSHAHLVHEFVSAIAEGRPPAVTASDAAHWLAAGVTAHKSALKGGEWLDLPL